MSNTFSAKKIASVAIIFSVVLMLGRVLGYVRELMVARLYGANETTDQIIILFTLPDLFLNLIVSGGLSGAIVPLLSKTPESLRSGVLKALIGVFAGFFVVVSLLTVCFSTGLVTLLAPGLSHKAATELSFAVKFLAIPIFFSGMIGLLNAWLGSHNNFIAGSSGGLLVNGFLIAGLYFSASSTYPVLLTLLFAIYVSSFLRIGVSAYLSVQYVKVSPTLWSFLSKSFVLKFLLSIVAVGLVQATPVIVRSLVSELGPGSLTHFNYAYKLVELPLILVVAVLSVVSLPTLSKHFSSGDLSRLQRLFLFKLALGTGASTVMLVVVHIYALPLVELLFERGQMTSIDIQAVKNLLQVLFFTLPFAAIAMPSVALLNAADRQADVIKSTIFALMMFVIYVVGLKADSVSDPEVMAAALPFFYAVYAIIALFYARKAIDLVKTNF